MPVNFNGQLRPNEIFSGNFNMIISQHVYADNIKHNYNLVSEFKTDGAMYGDSKLYYASDVLKSRKWTNDSEAANLLNINRPANPKCQRITISNFRQIDLTIDNYLTKRAWSTEGAFSSFNSVMLGWISETKKIYENTMFNSFIGTHVSEGASQQVKIDITSATAGLEGEAKARVTAQTIARDLEDLRDEMKDYSRNFNDYGFLRSYDGSEMMVIWNSKVANQITKVDLPTIFHKDGLLDVSRKLPSRFFGEVIPTASAVNGGKGDGKTIRTLVEKDYGSKHCFPGDLIPNNEAFLDKEAYKEDPTVVCKIIHKSAVPFMSAFETGTSFFNPRSLTENHYLTWGYSDLTHLSNYPYITVKIN